MTRTSTLIALAAASALLTPVVVHATGAAPKAPVEKAAPAAAAAVAAPMAESAPAACARKVKVVYAGYGETHAMACAAR